ncbi:zinc ABC transporter substrate-binding protein [Nocardioides sp. GY 10127]|uniref:metal ABC transporter solute-binding protein, Zn/Mn family n=1 Tax=Nocardioides sp. GY 10127 TaxID=2569762 RepID=UPI0010A7C18D|nr:zinc ABC transporter substrate-binding protein [Nocardioides sp. GY 10127]TIC79315.1 ABC transporter substrate-binding protein [Nocardioides sp. GY 10127]
MKNRTLRLAVALPVAGLLLGALSACSSSSSSEESAPLSIVASTNVYGSIASAIAGDDATVTSLITNANQDPHEYEATVKNQLAVSEADLVIENGGGYDDFMDKLVKASGTDATVLNAVEESGLAPAGSDTTDEIDGFNEHVWYDVAAVEKIAAAVRDDLSDADPDHTEDYAANYSAFVAQLNGLEKTEATLKKSYKGESAIITEPVPLYLLEAVGLKNKTPSAFSEAVEEGDDVPARVLQQLLDIIGSDDLALLAYNTQAADTTTVHVQMAAEAAGVPVVDFTETLPKGTSYVTWMKANLKSLSSALAS